MDSSKNGRWIIPFKKIRQGKSLVIKIFCFLIHIKRIIIFPDYKTAGDIGSGFKDFVFIISEVFLGHKFNPFPHTVILQQTTFRKILNVHSAERNEHFLS